MLHYGVETFFKKSIVSLHDPVFNHAWYLRSVSKAGVYTWTRDRLYARTFSEKTAMKHKTALENGADKDWKIFRDSWAEAYSRIRMA